VRHRRSDALDHLDDGGRIRVEELRVVVVRGAQAGVARQAVVGVS
jgi:hypothetical protein